MNDLLLKKLLCGGLLLVCIFSFSNCKKNNPAHQKAKEQKELDNLKAEIVKISVQVNCDNAADWKFATLINGPCYTQEYIPYSVKINEASFLEKVAVHNEKQKAFNAKWEANINCIMLPKVPPKGVTCVDGKAKLVY